MTIYKLTDEMLSKYKNKYGKNVCGANVLDLFGFPENTIKDLLEYRGQNFEWDDMVNVINNHDLKLQNKVWLKDKKKTTKEVLDYDNRDNRMNKMVLEFITEELKNNTYKIIGIAAEEWGHYMVIGKNSDGEILTFDPQNQLLIMGINNIIDDFNEDDIKKIISYSNGLIIDLTQRIGSGSRKYKKYSKKKKSFKKKKTLKKNHQKINRY